MEINFGQYGLPVIITVVLGLIFKTIQTIPNNLKPWIAAVVGIGLGIVGIPYAGKAWTVAIVVDHTIYGFMLGMTAVGIYEATKTIPRSKP